SGRWPEWPRARFRAGGTARRSRCAWNRRWPGWTRRLPCAHAARRAHWRWRRWRRAVWTSATLVDGVAHEPEFRRQHGLRRAEVGRRAAERQQFTIELHVVAVAAHREAGGLGGLSRISAARRTEVPRIRDRDSHRLDVAVERLAELHFFRAIAGRVDVRQIAGRDGLALHGARHGAAEGAHHRCIVSDLGHAPSFAERGL